MFWFKRFGIGILLLVLTSTQILVPNNPYLNPLFLSPHSQTFRSLNPLIAESKGRYEFVIETSERELKSRSAVGGDYTNYKIIGEGATGKIYEAVDKETGKRVALKVFNDEEKFYRELSYALRFQHPNVAHTFDYGNITIEESLIQYEEKKFFIAMELAQEDLRSVIVKSDPLSRLYQEEYELFEDEKLKIFKALLDGVQHMHSKGVAHGDLKPENVLLIYKTNERRPILIDFGTAYGEKEDFLSHLFGTFSYLSPEALKMTIRSAEPRSDIYSLGAILYFMFTGINPFEMVSVEIAARPVIPEQTSILPYPIWKMIEKAMDPDPSKRYSSALEFYEDIENYLNGKTEQKKQKGTPIVKAFRQKHKDSPVDFKNLFFFCFALHGEGLIDASKELVSFLHNHPLSISEKKVCAQMALQLHAMPFVRHPELLKAVNEQVVYSECKKALSNGSDIKKEKAVLLLGALRKSKDLIKVAKDKTQTWWVRETALFALAKIGNAEAMETLSHLEKSSQEDGLVIQAAKQALKKPPQTKERGPTQPSTLPILSWIANFKIPDQPTPSIPGDSNLKALVEVCLQDSYQQNCFNAAATLIKNRAYGPIMEVIKGARKPSDNYERDLIKRGKRSNNWSRIAIILNLLKIKDADSIPLFIEVAENKRYILEERLVALRALGKIGHLNPTDTLLRMLWRIVHASDEEANIQATAKETLFEILHKTKREKLKRETLAIMLSNSSLFSFDQLAFAQFSVRVTENDWSTSLSSRKVADSSNANPIASSI